MNRLSSRQIIRTLLVPSPLLVALCWLIATVACADDSTEHEFFEKQIRPLLIEKCVRCHGDKKQSGGLRLDSKAALTRGGDNGPVIVAGKPAKSRIISAIQRVGELAMPPDEELSEIQIGALTRWIKLGALWPDQSPIASDAPPHWAFQPVQRPDVPAVDRTDWVRTPIDAFVLAKLTSSGLVPSPQADRRTLIRRATFDLIGLPPSPEEVDAFVSDQHPDAWERLIDRLLRSRHYGEKWARHWLDIARYSDSKGYVYAREERHWVHAWSFRDWVVGALNDDMPYDRFLLLQIAADQADAKRDDLAAMGYLTIGRRFLGVTHDIIDDRIDVVTRGTMGLTVACARCHDHKYDPIPTEDYYSLYGVFRNCVEQLVPLAEIVDQESEFAKGLRERTKKFDEKLAGHRASAAARVRSRVHDYLAAQLDLGKFPEQGFDQILIETDMMPAFVRHWRDYLIRAAKQNDVVFSAWRMFQQIPAQEFPGRAAEVCKQIQSAPHQHVHPKVAQAFTSVPADMNDVVKRYGDLLVEADQRRQQQAKEADPEASANDPLVDVLYAADGPCVVPDEPIVNTEAFFPTKQIEELWKLQGEIDRFLMSQAQSPPHALTLVDRENPADVRVLLRGNPATLGDSVPRRFLSLFGGDQSSFESGSGRLELARAIIDPANPLTARVAVNRVWMHHFGAGLVRTPSDFGRRAEIPSHPQLLDWLATQFVHEGWSLKKLHRLIMHSATYQQSSFGPDDPGTLAQARQLDPENRLLWRMSPRRLTFEELRDATLAAGGKLNLKTGGKAVDLFQSDRRTLYAKIDRQFFPNVLRVFDVANPDLHIPKRNETTVPQQALFFMNHPFLIQQAKNLAGRCESDNGLKAVGDMYRIVYQRDPTDNELELAQRLIQAGGDEQAASRQDRKPSQWQYGFGEYSPGEKKLIGFQPLPYFNGTAWQGGPNWPDPALGWVQLTAAGGHAGNDKQHAAVRRWTAPRNMRISIESALIHEAKPGDGVRGFLVSSRQGLLKTSEVHLRTERFDIGTLDVTAGEMVDFVVDLRDNLNHEEYLWEAKISELPSDEKAEPASWISRQEFGGTPTSQLEPWEQLAQVLLSANEFMFVD